LILEQIGDQEYAQIMPECRPDSPLLDYRFKLASWARQSGSICRSDLIEPEIFHKQ
jgi:hypothetical protein